MNARLLLSIPLLLVACKAPPPPAGSAEATIEAAMRAGFLEHDLDAYMKVWAPEGRLIAGRTSTPDAHDVTMSYAQIEATKRLRFARRRCVARS